MSRFFQGKFRPRNPHKYVGDASNIVFRSSWERNFMEWLDTKTSVVNWMSEGLQIPYFFAPDGKWHRYFPDFVMTVKDTAGKNTVCMVEIKPHTQTIHPSLKPRNGNKKRMIKEALEYEKNQSKWHAANIYCKNKGWQFMVVTEKQLFPNV